MLGHERFERFTYRVGVCRKNQPGFGLRSGFHSRMVGRIGRNEFTQTIAREHYSHTGAEIPGDFVRM